MQLLILLNLSDSVLILNLSDSVLIQTNVNYMTNFFKLGKNELFSLIFVNKQKIISKKELIEVLLQLELLKSYGSCRNLIYKMLKNSFFLHNENQSENIQISEKGRQVLKMFNLIDDPLNDDQIRNVILWRSLRLIAQKYANVEDGQYKQIAVDSIYEAMKLISNMSTSEVQKIYQDVCQSIILQGEI